MLYFYFKILCCLLMWCIFIEHIKLCPMMWFSLHFRHLVPFLCIGFACHKVLSLEVVQFVSHTFSAASWCVAGWIEQIYFCLLMCFGLYCTLRRCLRIWLIFYCTNSVLSVDVMPNVLHILLLAVDVMQFVLNSFSASVEVMLLVLHAFCADFCCDEIFISHLLPLVDIIQFVLHTFSPAFWCDAVRIAQF